MREKVLVTGATGKVGSEVVRGLLQAGLEVKAGTRRPEVAHRHFQDEAVEVVELDYEHTQTWDAAVEWADGVFLVPPPFDPDAHDLLVPFLDWAVASRVEHVVLLSAMSIDRRDDLTLRRVERTLEASGARWTILRPNLYMQNFDPVGLSPGLLWELHRERGAVELPLGDARVSFVDGRDVARVAVDALSNGDHVGRTWTLTGPEALSFEEATARISQTSGTRIPCRRVDEEAFRDTLRRMGWTAPRIEVILDLFESVRTGVREEVTPDLSRLLGHRLRTFDTYAREVGEGWR